MSATKASRKKKKKTGGRAGRADVAERVSAQTLRERLETAWQQWRKSSRRKAPLVAWIAVDGWAGHRAQLGLAGAEALMDAIGERIAGVAGSGAAVADLGGGALGVMFAEVDAPEDPGPKLARAVGGSLIALDGDTVAATVSVALACMVADDDRPDRALLEAAALAERTSGDGGNRSGTCVRAQQPSDDPDRDLLRLLLDAIRDDSLRVVFQPLLGGDESTPVNYQMLPRLPGEDGELIPAARFVPVAARQGVLSTLDRWILGRALKSLTTYDNPDVLARLFVIQSPAIFDESRLFEWFGRQLDAAPDLAAKLVLEFPVGDVQPRLRSALPVIAALRERGVKVCIAGVDETVSAELVLEHVPADYLRMAAGFVQHLLSGGKPEERFRRFAARARAADRRIIVPMLEDAESVTRVWRMDVDLIQGNFIQEPREAPDG